MGNLFSRDLRALLLFVIVLSTDLLLNLGLSREFSWGWLSFGLKIGFRILLRELLRGLFRTLSFWRVSLFLGRL